MDANSDLSSIESRRIKALHSYNLLNPEKDDFLDGITSLATSICNTSIALISLVDEKKQWFKSKIGVDVRYTERAISFCHHTIKQYDVFEVIDALNDEMFAFNPLVTGKFNLRFYAGVPLRDPDGYNIGTLCVIDHKPKKLSDAQKAALKMLAGVAIDYIVLKKAKEQNIELTAQLSNFFCLSPDLFCTASPDGYFTRINEAFVRELGYEEKELLQSKFMNFVHDDDKEKTKEAMNIMNLKAENVMFFRNRYRCKNGKYIWLSWNAIPNVTTGTIYATARNITGLIELEDELKKKKEIENKFQEEKFRQLCNLTSSISHELLNPINLTIGFAEITLDLLKDLSDPCTAENKKEVIEQIKEDQLKIIEHSKGVFNILHKMDYNIAHDHITLIYPEGDENKVNEVNLLCEQFERIAYDNFRSKHHDFQCEFVNHFDEKNPKCHITIVEFGESVLNIFYNAFEAMLQKKKMIHAHLSNISLKTALLGDKVEILITDNGVGIPKEDISKIFNPFFTTKNSEKGKGLGLTSSLSIINNNHGSLCVEKSNNNETVFKIILPAA